MSASGGITHTFLLLLLLLLLLLFHTPRRHFAFLLFLGTDGNYLLLKYRCAPLPN